MALTIKSLGRGTVPQPTQGPICGPVAAGKAVIVRNMRFVNTNDTNTATLNVFFKRGSNTYRLLEKNLIINAKKLHIDVNEVALEANDSIEAVVLTGETVDYVISGIERDI